MNEKEKLRVLIPHWIEHNLEHADEYRRWSGFSSEVSTNLGEAAETLIKVNEILGVALEKLGKAAPHANS